MPPRALIISVENYDRSNVLAKKLPGTDAGATAFRQWLVERKGLDPVRFPDAIRCCAGAGFQGRTSGTTRKEIIDELKYLVEHGHDDTPELYFFFVGHGFAYPLPRGGPIDVLVASDFTDLANSGDACLQLQEIQEKLWASMGPGEHYYFVDACRNPVAEKDIDPVSLGKVFATSDLGKPSRYTLFSTAPGQAAAVGSGFARVLVDGLQGRGRAKGWRGREMYVTFERLFEYVRSRVKMQELESMSRGDGQGLILKLDPIPQSQCRITIEGAAQDEEFVPRLTDVRNFPCPLVAPFRGATYDIMLPPEDYFVEVRRSNTVLVKVQPPGDDPLDLYDSCEVRFRKSPPTALEAVREDPVLEEYLLKTRDRPPTAEELREEALRIREAMLGRGTAREQDGGPLGPPMSAVDLRAADHTEIEVSRLQTGEVYKATGRLNQVLPPGDYEVRVREDGLTVHQERIVVAVGQSLKRDLLVRPVSETRRSILEAISGQPAARLAKFDTISPMANWDLSLWLALMGASRIVASPTLRMQLEALPLTPFEDLGPGQTAFYLLTALEHVPAVAECGVGLSRGAVVPWQPLRPVDSLYKVRHSRLEAEPGWRLLSLHVPGQVPITFASFALANRVTLVTIVRERGGLPRVHQYLLPLHHLTGHLPDRVRQNLDLSSLNLVRTMYSVQQAFAEQRSLKPAEGAPWSDWHQLAYQKWLDPALSLLVAYDMARQGRAGRQEALAREMVQNLRTYFGEIPDVEAVARLLGMDWTPPQAPPLLVDGLMAFQDTPDEAMFPLSRERLDYGNPWTTWRGAVNDYLPR
jgi:hypothetical protein